MENHPHESIDTVFGCVIPYLHDGDDRNSVSLVCHKWYELDSMTRKHVTVHVHLLYNLYSPAPSRLHQGFPSIESLTLQGFPVSKSLEMTIDITDWIQEISVSYKCLKALHIRLVSVLDSDLELLARTRGKDIRLLKIIKCCGFSTDGLMHIGKYCTDLKSLSLKGSKLDDNKDGKWRIGVTSLPPLGCLPAVRTLFGSHEKGCVSNINADAQAFKRKVNAAATKLRKQLLGLKIVIFDIYQPLYDLVKNPSSQGFVEATRGCCGTGTVETTVLLCNPKSVGTCKNATQYVFWDSFHPSQAANQILADALLVQGIALLG